MYIFLSDQIYCAVAAPSGGIESGWIIRMIDCIIVIRVMYELEQFTDITDCSFKLRVALAAIRTRSFTPKIWIIYLL